MRTQVHNVETKEGLMGLRQYTRSNRQEVETRRSLNTVPTDTGKRGGSENAELGSKPRDHIIHK